MSAKTIDQISLDAWLSVAKTVKKHSKRIYDHHKREEVDQEALIIFARRYQGYLVNPDCSFDFSVEGTAQLAKWCIETAAKKLGCCAVKDAAGETVQFIDLDEIAELPAPTNFYQSPSERALADKVNFIFEHANRQPDKRFSDICRMLYQGFQQNEIAGSLGLSPATVNDLIRKNRNQLLAAQGGF